MGYSKFERQTWNDEKVRRWPRDTREVWVYLNTSPHMEGAGGRIGAYALDPMYAAADLSTPDHRWTPEAVEAQFVWLHERGRIVWDPDNRVILLVNFFRYNQPENPNQANAAGMSVRDIPASITVLEQLRNSCLQLLPETFKSGTPLRAPVLAAIDDRISKVKSEAEINSSETVTETVPPTVGVTTEPEPEPNRNQSHQQLARDESLGAKAPQADAPDEDDEDDENGEETPLPTVRQLVPEVAPLVRRHLWLGKQPPPNVLEVRPDWSEGREADVVRCWIRDEEVVDLEEAKGVIRFARHALDMEERPFSLLFLHDAEGRGRLQEALSYTRKELAKEAEAAERSGKGGPKRIDPVEVVRGQG